MNPSRLWLPYCQMQTAPAPQIAVRTDGGVILETVNGERSFLGDTAKYGFYEPGTVIRLTAPEMKDGKPNLINFDFRDGTFVVSKVLETGYLAIGKQKMGFDREDQ